jgi:NDP-sugar pyrophosphorylase family protein
VKGLVLAAGQAQRLRPLTNDLPKTLLPVAGDRTILDLTLANLHAVGIEDVVVVTGFAAERIEERTPEL